MELDLPTSDVELVRMQRHVRFVILGNRVVLDVGPLHECILVLLSLGFLCINDEYLLSIPLL